METISLYAYAKLNLALEVVGKRQDGYHNMDMLMQSVSLCDTLCLTKVEQGILLVCDQSDVPCGSDNIAFRVAEKFFSFTGTLGGVEINLKKQIPSQAGMAGGSADAAAVLHGLNTLYKTDLSLSQLCQIGVTLGADVPFCLTGGTAHVTGIGEKIEPVVSLPVCYFVIVKPKAGISTAAAFQAIDCSQTLQKVNVDAVLKAVNSKDVNKIALSMCNSFEQVTKLHEVFDAKQNLIEAGALGALMSGSGSAVFGMFKDHEKAVKALENLKNIYEEAYLAEPVLSGVSIN